MIVYRIAGVTIALDLPDDFPESGAFANYRIREAVTPDVSVTVETVPQIEETGAVLLHEDGEFRIRQEEGGPARYFFDRRTEPPYAVLREESPHRLHFSYREDHAGYFTSVPNFIRRLALERMLLNHGAFILHASYIELPKGALLFTGPSGIGKSTQAALWETCAGAALVNGDRVGIRCDGPVTAHGLPYAGSSQCFRNVTLPILGIVRLEQAGEDRVTRLAPVAAFRYLYEQATVNIWDPAAVEAAAALVATVCEQVPVCHFACTKEPSAVTALRTALGL